MSTAASQVSVHPAVRRVMVARQQELGRRGGVVMDGRDIGTAVFPDADVKFYVDADPAKRAVRRRQELAEAGIEADARRPSSARSASATTPTPPAPTRRSPAPRTRCTWTPPTLGLEEVVERMLARGARRGDRARRD